MASAIAGQLAKQQCRQRPIRAKFKPLLPERRLGVVAQSVERWSGLQWRVLASRVRFPLTPLVAMWPPTSASCRNATVLRIRACVSQWHNAGVITAKPMRERLCGFESRQVHGGFMSKRKPRRIVSPQSSDPRDQGYAVCRNEDGITLEVFAGNSHTKVNIPLDTAIHFAACVNFSVTGSASYNGMPPVECMKEILRQMTALSEEENTWNCLHNTAPANS